MKKKKKTTGAGHVFRRILQCLGTILLVSLLSVLIFACIFVFYVKNDLAKQADLSVEDLSINQTSIIYCKDQSTGQWKELQKLFREENRIWVPYEEIPTDLVNSAIAIEDKRFLDHNGVDWVTTMRACARLFLGNSGAGGSTITQQLMKNLTGDQEITVRRKIVEIVRALQFERTHSKEEIMEWYMNVIYMGEGCSGVRSAAQVYFGKDVSDLTLAECASLIGITNNPSLYDPYIHPENNRSRQLTILGELLEQEYISREQYDRAVAQEMVFTRGKSESDETSGQYYSYFVDEVIRDVVTDLMTQYDCTESIAKNMLYCGGYSIYCTMDSRVQGIMEQVYGDLENVPETVSDQQLQSAMVVIDNATGDVVGIVGGVGEKGGSLTLSRASQSTLSPGSTIKPITVYGPALDLGIITPGSVLDDAPYTFYGGKPYPKNTSNTYKGLVTVNYAVGQSLNTIPVRLVEQMTPEYCYTFAKEKMGLSTLVADLEVDGNKYTDAALAPMAMGGLTKGVTVRDMTNAYATFPNQGEYRKARVYTEVLDSKGNTILNNEQESHAAMKRSSAWYMTDMLHNATLTGTSTQARMEGFDVAAKTGTTTSDQDRWFAAYTGYYTGVVWCGYDVPEEVILSGSSTNPSLAMWKQVMTKLHEGLAPKAFETPENVEDCYVCADSGLLPTEACRCDPRGGRTVKVRLFRSDRPTKACDVHKIVEVCEESGALPSEYCPAIKTVGLLDLSRAFPGQGVAIADQDYAIGKDPLQEGYYRPSGYGRASYTEICTVHTEETQPEEPPEETPVPPTAGGDVDTPPAPSVEAVPPPVTQMPASPAQTGD